MQSRLENKRLQNEGSQSSWPSHLSQLYEAIVMADNELCPFHLKSSECGPQIECKTGLV